MSGRVLSLMRAALAVSLVAIAGKVMSGATLMESPTPFKRLALPETRQTEQTQQTLQSEPHLKQLRSRALTVPVQGVVAAQLTDTYTQARAAGAVHEALDIMAERGTPVLAVEDGEVVKLFTSKPGGITLYQFDPGKQYAYYYAHMDRYAEGVREGAKLRQGQVIGYVGSTGNALPDAAHLHFAIFLLGPERQWWRGTPLNPFRVWRDIKN